MLVSAKIVASDVFVFIILGILDTDRKGLFLKCMSY